MERWLTGLRSEERISFITLLALCLLLIVVPIYQGGSRFEGQSFLFLLAGPIAYFAWRSNAAAFFHSVTRPVSIVFFLLLCVMALSLIPSADRFMTFMNLLHWIAFYVIFVSAQVVVDSPKRFALLSGAAIVSATLLALTGLYGLLTTDNLN